MQSLSLWFWNPFLYTILVATDGHVRPQTSMKFAKYWFTKMSKRVRMNYIPVMFWNPFLICNPVSLWFNPSSFFVPKFHLGMPSATRSKASQKELITIVFGERSTRSVEEGIPKRSLGTRNAKYNLSGFSKWKNSFINLMPCRKYWKNIIEYNGFADSTDFFIPSTD